MDEPAPLPAGCTGAAAGELVRIVKVRLRGPGRVFSFDAGGLDLRCGESVVVETPNGLELGRVLGWVRTVAAADMAEPLRRVVRRATPEDLASREAWRRKEDEAFEVALERIQRHELPMRLVDAEYAFDGSRLTFYFTADGRVDFRELVRDLAGRFRTRIDLRQIGARDVARMVGGIGPCGRPVCCASFLGELRPVTLRMAKDQGLALNPEKLSGLCGRLLCCLAFELDRPACPVGAALDESEPAEVAPLPAEGGPPPS